MVKALHRAGIEVILDVVFNHSAEGDDKGPTISFRGLDNRAYYILDGYRRYANFTGCGNTLKANHPVVRRLILDALRHWVSEMHVDGFRFDLASVLSRDTDGNPLHNAPAVWDIESDPVLAGSKLIAEAWDAAGLYQVGRFVGDSWKEWNGKFRDDVRSFLRGDPGRVSHFANRLLASPDLYEQKQREPEQSVNFVTCHDGFTLNDLVTYEVKHNEANGEENRDGSDHELSWNCGVEGPSDDPAVEQLRNRQVKNFLAVNLLSAGVPMILMGDEMRRTQRGNNNAWCQDNETSWLDWSLRKTHADVHRFLRRLIRLRSSVHPGPAPLRDAHPVPPQRPHRVARGEARRARLERPGPEPRRHLPGAGRPGAGARDGERLERAARVRAAPREERVAPHGGHLPALPRRHPELGGGGGAGDRDLPRQRATPSSSWPRWRRSGSEPRSARRLTATATPSRPRAPGS